MIGKQITDTLFAHRGAAGHVDVTRLRISNFIQVLVNVGDLGEQLGHSISLSLPIFINFSNLLARQNTDSRVEILFKAWCQQIMIHQVFLFVLFFRLVINGAFSLSRNNVFIDHTAA